ncbi:DUF262 domain-containing protein [Occultella kanbiaonis]|uniref:DUF262 domain-containing protein n=1 Tax=Occultella kanbiaonis TaxID=2675754 RepID=UPI0012B6CCB2|nr:DUF262 domain-containing protein [Occultella kanbiaonis]
MSLVDQIAQRAREIRTDGYSMSIGEVLSLYRDGDIDIHPEFQRIFRWDDDQKSRLIESVLLGIPIPPIFVSQRADGVWDVIDGVQRLSTILQFAGEYKNESDMPQPELVLRGGEYLTELDGYVYSKPSEPGTTAFNEALRRDFKRAKLDFRIITKESDPNAKYDLFQRLNSGSVLSPQEARNCLMVMIDRSFYQRVVELSQNANFQASVLLSDRQEEQAYREELVLRFFCQVDLTGGPTELKKEYGEYLTGWMRNAADPESTYSLDTATFNETFELLNRALGEDTFRRHENGRHLGPFSISSYEFVTSGVASNLDRWRTRPSTDLKSRVESIWSADVFRSNSGTGVSPRRRVPRLMSESRKYFGE